MKWVVKKNLLLTWRPEKFPDSQLRSIEINCGRADQRSLSIEPLSGQ
jgi:hypothetical protein